MKTDQDSDPLIVEYSDALNEAIADGLLYEYLMDVNPLSEVLIYVENA